MLRPEEVEMLVCGCPTIDMQDLQKVTTYDGFNEDDTIIKFVIIHIILNKFFNLFQIEISGIL